MATKICLARIEELNGKLRRKAVVRARIETMQREMQQILNHMSSETAKQLMTSSFAAILRRPNAQRTSVDMQDEVDALRHEIAGLKAEEARLESQIKSFQA
ncbi:hypothetical protein E4U42_007502 [Claviceps africana]|uniref:Uncharacterized protein n=1 Tax=Claviceps africana TaxID=83212 RepID=A0A8K0J1M7_9HYPO|nr:hypothetical protein E4U42_007502 [Claviceps africana]